MNLLYLLESDQIHQRANVKACLKTPVIAWSAAEQDNGSIDDLTVFLTVTNQIQLYSTGLGFFRKEKKAIFCEYFRNNVLTDKL